MNIASTFKFGQTIPKEYVCSGLGGKNISPPLTWNSVPGAKSYAVLCYDPDIPDEVKLKIEQPYWIHWLVYNLEQPNLSAGQKLSANKLLKNTSGKLGYEGMCPPDQPQHRYYFCVYALDRLLDKLNDQNDFIEKVNEYSIAKECLIGLF